MPRARARAMRSSCEHGGHTVPGTADLARLGALVRLLRSERDMPQAELARRALVARSTIQRLEKGQLRPRPSLLAWVAQAIDPDHAKVIRPALVEAAGGRTHLPRTATGTACGSGG